MSSSSSSSSHPNPPIRWQHHLTNTCKVDPGSSTLITLSPADPTQHRLQTQGQGQGQGGSGQSHIDLKKFNKSNARSLLTEIAKQLEIPKSDMLLDVVEGNVSIMFAYREEADRFVALHTVLFEASPLEGCIAHYPNASEPDTDVLVRISIENKDVNLTEVHHAFYPAGDISTCYKDDLFAYIRFQENEALEKLKTGEEFQHLQYEIIDIQSHTGGTPADVDMDEIMDSSASQQQQKRRVSPRRCTEQSKLRTLGMVSELSSESLAKIPQYFHPTTTTSSSSSATKPRSNTRIPTQPHLQPQTKATGFLPPQPDQQSVFSSYTFTTTTPSLAARMIRSPSPTPSVIPNYGGGISGGMLTNGGFGIGVGAGQQGFGVMSGGGSFSGRTAEGGGGEMDVDGRVLPGTDRKLRSDVKKI